MQLPKSPGFNDDLSSWSNRHDMRQPGEELRAEKQVQPAFCMGTCGSAELSEAIATAMSGIPESHRAWVMQMTSGTPSANFQPPHHRAGLLGMTWGIMLTGSPYCHCSRSSPISLIGSDRTDALSGISASIALDGSPSHAWPGRLS